MDLKGKVAVVELRVVDRFHGAGSQARTTSTVEWGNIHAKSARSSEWLHHGSATIRRADARNNLGRAIDRLCNSTDFVTKSSAV